MKLKAVSGIMLALLIISMLALAFNIQLVKAEPTTWTVDDNGPADFSSIQEAINGTSAGDTIIVYAGTYIENVIVNKRLTIKSQSGAENTIVRTVDPEAQKNVFEITANDVVLKGFTATVMVGWGGKGIYLRSVNYCVISDNICCNNSAGIYLSHSHDNLITNNDVSKNQNGMYLHQSRNNRIMNNVASKSSKGIYLVFSSYNEVINNTVNENWESGIALIEYPTNNNLIANNTIHSNRGSGISLCHVENNIIINNNIMNNGGAVHLWGTSKNNTIFHNNFIINNVYIANSEINTWDDGYLSGGNYWSDYTGTDADNDGIGDTPYIINENNQDNYPLMTPWALECYELTATSSPITGITFRINGVPHITPDTIMLPQGSYTLEMPETYVTYSNVTHSYVTCVWSHWLEDGDTNRTKIVNMNTNITLTAVFTLETTPLIISILSPENKTYTVTDVPLEFTVSESTSWMGYSLDGQTNTTITGNTTISGLLDGTHYVVVYANDTAGNMGTSGTVCFTVDTTPPSITGVSQIPPENNWLPGDGIKVNATVTDAVSGVEWVALNYTNGNGTWVIVEMTNLEGNIWNATIPAFPHSTNITYMIIAKDKVYNTITTEELFGYQYQYQVIPQFPSFLILLLFMIATLLAVIVYRRKHST